MSHKEAVNFCDEFLSECNIKYLELSSRQVVNIKGMLKPRLRMLLRAARQNAVESPGTDKQHSKCKIRARYSEHGVGIL